MLQRRCSAPVRPGLVLLGAWQCLHAPAPAMRALMRLAKPSLLLLTRCPNAVSGTVPEEPVINKNSGLLFEKRLVEKHVQVR